MSSLRSTMMSESPPPSPVGVRPPVSVLIGPFHVAPPSVDIHSGLGEIVLEWLTLVGPVTKIRPALSSAMLGSRAIPEPGSCVTDALRRTGAAAPTGPEPDPAGATRFAEPAPADLPVLPAVPGWTLFAAVTWPGGDEVRRDAEVRCAARATVLCDPASAR
jgi:hypothetical protein